MKNDQSKVHLSAIANKLLDLATSARNSAAFAFNYLHKVTITTPKEQAMRTVNAIRNQVFQLALQAAYTTKESILPMIPEPVMSLSRTILNTVSSNFETGHVLVDNARESAVRNVEAARRFSTETAKDAKERTLMNATTVTSLVYTTVRDTLHLANTIDTTKNVIEHSAENIYTTVNNYLQTVNCYKTRTVENIKGGVQSKVQSAHAAAKVKFVKIEHDDRSQFVLRFLNDVADQLFLIRDFLSSKVKSYTADVVHQKDHLVGKVNNNGKHVRSSSQLQSDKSGVQAA